MGALDCRKVNKCGFMQGGDRGRRQGKASPSARPPVLSCLTWNLLFRGHRGQARSS